MRTIGRDKLFQDIQQRLIDIREESGHVPFLRAVSAPSRGGLTTFLEDLTEHLGKMGGLLSVMARIDDGLSEVALDDAFAKMTRQIATEAHVHIEGDGQLAQLFSACAALQVRKILPVIILDVAEGIRAIQRNHSTIEQAKRAPLLQRLRVLANLVQDQEPNLAVIVGWDTEFASLSPIWRADDVVQRYPVTPLWPDFGEGNAWPIYSEILKARGYQVKGAYPGFCRSGIPVGVLIDALEAANPKPVVDGRWLLELLRTHKKFDPAIENADPDALVAFCLEDGVVSGGPLRDALTSPALQGYVEPTTEASGYVANELLYQAMGLRPAQVILSLERRIRQLYEEGPDNELSLEVARGIASLVGGNSAETKEGTEAGLDWACLKFPLAPELLPIGCRKLRIILIIALGHQMPQELKGQLVDELTRIAGTAGERARSLIVLAHRYGYDAAGFKGALASELRQKGVIEILGKGALQSAKDAPISLCSVELSDDLVVQAVYRARDPKRTAKELSNAIGGELDKHVKRVQRDIRVLSTKMFGQQVLPLFLKRAHRPIEFDEALSTLSAGGVSQKDLKERLSELVNLNIVSEQQKRYIWRFTGDDVLKQLREDPSLKTLLEKYFFDADDWPAIGHAIAGAYGEGHVQFTNGELSATDGKARARICAESLVNVCKERVATLEASGDRQAADEYRRAISELAQRLGVSVSLQDLAGVIDELVDKERQIQQAGIVLLEERNLLKNELTKIAEELKKAPATHAHEDEQEREACLGLYGDVDGYSVADLKQIRNRMAACLKSFEDDRNARAQIVAEVKASIQPLSSIRSEIDDLDRDLEAVRAGSSWDQLKSEISELVKNCDELLEKLKTWQTKPVALPRAAWRKEVDSELGKIGGLKIRTQRLRRRLGEEKARPERVPTPPTNTSTSSKPKNAPTPQPAPSGAAKQPVGSPSGDSVIAGSETGVTSRRSPDGPVASPEPPQPAGDSGSRPEVPPSAGAQSGLGTETSPTPEEPPVSVALDPVATPVPPSSPTVRVDEFGPQDLEALAALLESGARIVHVEIDS